MTRHNPGTLLVLLSTRQQIANFKAIKQFMPARVLALSSERAGREHWNEGLERCVRNLDIDFEVLPISTGNMQVGELLAEFERLVMPRIGASHTVYWAWTGAQKPPATALFLLGYENRRNDQTREHILLYAEGNASSLIVEGAAQPLPFTATLTEQEVLGVHGVRAVQPSEQPDLATPGELHAFLHDQSARYDAWQAPGYIEDLEELFRMHEQGTSVTLEKIKKCFTIPPGDNALNEFIAAARRNVCLPVHNEVMPLLDRWPKTRDGKIFFAHALRSMGLRAMKKGNKPRHPASGSHFEALARTRLQQWLDAEGHRWVSRMAFNIKIQYPTWATTPETTGEFDCLFITHTGDFIVLDFKAAGQYEKYRQQRYTVNLAGGVFARLLYLYPWISRDMDPVVLNAFPQDAPDHVRRRLRGIRDMDASLGKNGIRFLEDDTAFSGEMKSKLGFQ